mgnify:CR=1 FL=1
MINRIYGKYDKNKIYGLFDLFKIGHHGTISIQRLFYGKKNKFNFNNFLNYINNTAINFPKYFYKK